MRDIKKGFHEDSSYVNGGPDKAFQLMILLRTESTQKHALIQHQYLVKKQNIIVLYSLRVFSGYTLGLVTAIPLSEKKRSPFQFLTIKISSSLSAVKSEAGTLCQDLHSSMKNLHENPSSYLS